MMPPLKISQRISEAMPHDNTFPIIQAPEEVLRQVWAMRNGELEWLNHVFAMILMEVEEQYNAE